MTIPTIEQVKALNGKIFAMLSDDEQAVLDFYRLQGRKYGVTVEILNEADPEELARAASREQADQILKRANSRVSVVCFNDNRPRRTRKCRMIVGLRDWIFKRLGQAAGDQERLKALASGG